MARVALRPLHSILEGAARAQQIQQARAYQQWRQQQQQWALQDRQRQEEERQRTEAARQALAGILAQRALQTQQNQPSEVGPPRTSIIPQSNFPGLSPTQPMQPPPQLITKTLAPQQTTLDPNIQALIQASPDAYLSLQQALAPKVPQAWPEAPYVMGDEGQPVPNIGAKPIEPKAPSIQTFRNGNQWVTQRWNGERMVTIATAPISESDPLVEMTDVAAGQIFKVPQSQAKKLADASNGNLKPGRPIPEKAAVDTTGLKKGQKVYYDNYYKALYEIRDLEKAIGAITGNIIGQTVPPGAQKKLDELQAMVGVAAKRAQVAKASFVAVGGDPAMLGEEANKATQTIPPGQPTGAQSPGGSQDYDWRDYQ